MMNANKIILPFFWFVVFTCKIQDFLISTCLFSFGLLFTIEVLFLDKETKSSLFEKTLRNLRIQKREYLNIQKENQVIEKQQDDIIEKIQWIKFFLSTLCALRCFLLIPLNLINILFISVFQSILIVSRNSDFFFHGETPLNQISRWIVENGLKSFGIEISDMLSSNNSTDSSYDESEDDSHDSSSSLELLHQDLEEPFNKSPNTQSIKDLENVFGKGSNIFITEHSETIESESKKKPNIPIRRRIRGKKAKVKETKKENLNDDNDDDDNKNQNDSNNEKDKNENIENELKN